MAWSENYKYKNPDITGLVENVKKMMGVDSGAAGRRSRNMSDFLTGAKTEEQQLKNIMLGNKNQAFTQGIDDPTLQNMFGQFLPTILSSPGSANALALALKTGKLTPDILRQQKALADVGEQDVAKGQAIKMLRERMLDYQPPEPELGGDRSDADWVRSARSARQGTGRELNERDMQMYQILTKGNIGTGADPTGRYTKEQHEKKIEKEGKIIDFYQVKIDGFKQLNGKRVTEVLKRTDAIIADMGIAKDIGTERVNQIRQAVLDDVNLNIRKIQNQEDQNKLIQERILTEGQRLEKEGHLTSKAKKEDDATGGRLHREKRKEEIEIDTLKVKRGTADSKKQMASMDLAGYKEKLKNLKEQREDLLAKGKILLENAKTEGERKKLDLEIKKELRPLDKQIKDLAIEMADVNIRSKSRESLTKTSSPPQIEREKQLRLEQIEAKKRSNSGSGGDATTEEMIKARMGVTNGEGTSTTGGLPVPVSKKSMPPDPEAKSVLNELLAVPPEQLLGWADEDIEKAVAMIQQKFPNMHPERIKRLIVVQMNRSK